MDISAISNNSADITSLLTNNVNGFEGKGKGLDPTNKTAYYAKKGEPMYMADMDADDDGTVTLDEFKAYCKSKDIKTRDMIKMSNLASAYRTLKAENEAIDYISKLLPNVFPKLKQADSSSNNVKQNENKYNISADENNAKRVTYKDYMEYCEQNTVPQELCAKTKFEETKEGELKITNIGKAVNSYKSTDTHNLKNTFEDVV